MDDPKQFIRDPATGQMVEGRWVCPSCKTVNVGPRCCYPPCGWDREGARKPVTVSDDTGEFEPLKERLDSMAGGEQP